MTLTNSSDSTGLTQSTNSTDDSKSSPESPLNNGIAVSKSEQGIPVKERQLLVHWRSLWRLAGFKEKRLWDFMELFLVPVLVAGLGFMGSHRITEIQNRFTKDQHDQDQKLADSKAKQDQKLSDDKARQDTLVKYLDQMSVSLKDGLLEAQPDSEEFIIAQGRTVTALQSLDRTRQHLIFQFLRASHLSNKKDGQRTGLLHQAQMDKANLVYSDLSGSVFFEASLKGANLGCVQPENALPKGPYSHSQCSDLASADFSGAILENADLRYADLNGAWLNGTNFTGANLSGANVSGAIFKDTDLSHVDVSTIKNFDQAKFCNTKFSIDIKLNLDRDCKEVEQLMK